MGLNFDDIKHAVSALHPAQAMEVAKIAQIAVADAVKEGSNWDNSPASGGGAVFVPPTKDFMGFAIAAAAAAAVGGGTVQLQSGEYNWGANEWELANNVSIIGIPAAYNSPDSGAPDIGSQLIGGTVIVAAPGTTPFKARSVPGGRFTASISGTTLTVTAMRAGPDGVVGLIEKDSRVVGPGVQECYIREQLTGTPGAVGTYRINISQTVASADLFCWRSVNYLSGVVMKDLAFRGGKTAIKIGAYNTVGATWSHFDNLHFFDTEDYSCEFYNFQHCQFTNIFSIRGGHAPRLVMWADGPMGGIGNSKVSKIYAYNSGKPLSRGIELGTDFLGTSAGIGVFSIDTVQMNHYNRVALSINVTPVNGSADISVPDASQFPVGMPLRFQSNNYGFLGQPFDSNNANLNRPAYFVASSNATTNVITVAESPNSAAKVATSGSGTITIERWGWPHITISGGGFSAANIICQDLDAEGSGAMILLNRLSQSVFGSIAGSTSDGSSLAIRSSSGLSFSNGYIWYVDAAGLNTNLSWFGSQPKRMSTAGGGNRVAVYQSRSIDLTGQGPVTGKSLENYSPGNGDWTRPGVPMGQSGGNTASANTSINLGSTLAGSTTYNGAGAGTITWTQDPGSGTVGLRQSFKNVGGGLLTVTLGGGGGTYDKLTGGTSLGKSISLSAPSGTTPGGVLEIEGAGVPGDYFWAVIRLTNGSMV